MPAKIAFWLVLLLAIGLGGRAALSGLPAFADLFAPAQAQGDAVSSTVSFPIRVAAKNSPYAPHVLSAGRGLPDWLISRIRFLRASPIFAQQPKIAIVIDDVGADVPAARRAMALPNAVSLSFLPYPDNTPMLAREAEQRGHQVLVHIPMEPEGHDDPGPNALLTSLDRNEITRRLDWALSRVPGYAGVNNHMGSLFTQDRDALVPVMEQLAEAHVFFLDSRTTPKTIVVPMARMFGVASAGRDVFLDDVETREAIAAQLAETEVRAKEQGVAIAIGHPHDVTLDALAEWTKNLRGYELVPVSEAIRLKSESETKRVSLSAARH